MEAILTMAPLALLFPSPRTSPVTAQEHTLEVHVQNPVPVGLGLVPHTVEYDYAGVVDQNVNLAKTLKGLADQPVYRVGPG